jgi:hypothetical protein
MGHKSSTGGARGLRESGEDAFVVLEKRRLLRWQTERRAAVLRERELYDEKGQV